MHLKPIGASFNHSAKLLIGLSLTLGLLFSCMSICAAEDAPKTEEQKTPEATGAPQFPWSVKPGETPETKEEPEEPDPSKKPVNTEPQKRPPPPPQVDDPEKARKFKAQMHAFEAGKLLKQRAYKYAAMEFKAASNFEPENLNYVLGFANCAHEANDWSEAVEAYNRLLKADPSHKEVHKTLGECFNKLGRYDDSVAAYKKAVDFEKDKADVWRRIAAIRTSQSRLPDAMEAYRMATKADPSDGKSYKNLAAMQWQNGNKSAAIATYKEGVARSPRDRDLQGAYAYALMSNSQWQEAASAYQAAAKLGGTTPEFDAGYKSAMEHIAYDEAVAKQKADAEARRAAKLHPLRK